VISYQQRTATDDHPSTNMETYLKEMKYAPFFLQFLSGNEWWFGKPSRVKNSRSGYPSELGIDVHYTMGKFSTSA